ncbi:MAG: phosphodiesterase, partial [Pseudomonadales bacterium]
THVDGQAQGLLGAARRQALLARIASATGAHILLACHHPPLSIDSPWLDQQRIPDGRELLESVAADDRVRGLVFGHVHQEVTTRFAGLAVLGTPSTCFQFEPGSQRFAIDRSPRSGVPGYRWLELHADGALASDVRRADGYAMNIDLPHRS